MTKTDKRLIAMEIERFHGGIFTIEHIRVQGSRVIVQFLRIRDGSGRSINEFRVAILDRETFAVLNSIIA